MAYNKETQMWEGYIYCIENIINHKKYIGQTIVSIHRRWIQHKNNNEDNSYIDRAIKKYGEDNFIVKELLVCYSSSLNELKEELNYLEVLLIDLNNTHHNKGGYNISYGGTFNFSNSIPVDVYNIKGELLNSFISYTQAADYYNLSETSISLICSGKQSNYKDKYVFRNKGDLFDKYNHYRRIIYQFDVSGIILNTFKSISEVKRQLGIKIQTLNNPNRLSGGYWWSTEPIFNYKNNSKKIPVDVYNTNGDFIKSFDSIKDASKFTNVCHENISRMLNGYSLQEKGFVFVKKDIPFEKSNYKRGALTMGKPVNQYTIDGEYIQTFKTISEATKYFTDKKSIAIHSCCNHKKHYNTAFGYKWFYAYDIKQPDKTKILKNKWDLYDNKEIKCINL